MTNSEKLMQDLGISANVLEGSDRPTVLITVEGRVGSAKTAIIELIQKLLQEKDVEVLIADAYTQGELKTHAGAVNEQELKMYNPKVILREKLNPNFTLNPMR
jgi:uridine kinase